MRLRVLVVASLALVVAGCDWPMFGYSPFHTRSSFDKEISAADAAGFALAWTATTGGTNAVASSPAVTGSRVYVGSPADNKLYVLDASAAACPGTPKTCGPLWTATTGGPVISSPAIANGVVYVGSNDHKLYAFDVSASSANCTGAPPTKTCTPLWTATTGAEVRSSPTVVRGVVYVGSDDHKLYAFDASGSSASCTGAAPNKTCTPLWTATTGGMVGSSPTIANGVVYVGSGDAKLYAFDVSASSANCTGASPSKTCTPLWTAITGAAIRETAAVGTEDASNPVVYINSDKLYAFDANGTSAHCTGAAPSKTCAPLWTATTGGSMSSPAVAGGRVYVGSTEHILHAYDAGGCGSASCAPLWTGPAGSGQSSPAVVNGLVFIGSNTDQKLDAFDANGSAANCIGAPPNKICAPLWGGATGGVTSGPAVADGVVYVGSQNGRLYAFLNDKSPPVTSITQPVNAATVSGTAMLDAIASDNVNVSSVEFHLTGGSYNDTLIGVATPNPSSWVYAWDTTTVPTGAYTLTSVARDAAGNVGRSPGLTVRVCQAGCTRLFFTTPNPPGSAIPCNPCFSDLSSTASIGTGQLSGDTITVDPSQAFQKIDGFGFALTDTSAYLIDQIPNDQGQRDAFLQQLFDPDQGIGISWVRVIMGPSDFTVAPRPWYSYRPTPADPFDVGRARNGSPNGDFSHIIPVLQQIITASSGQVSIFANPHSAPAWMKGNNDMWNLGVDGCLLGYCSNSSQDLRDQYAQYFIDFIKTYESNGIPIQSVQIQNEPNNLTNYPGGNFTADEQLDLIGRVKTLMATQSPPLTQKVWAEFGSWEATNIFSGAGTKANAVDGFSYHCYFGPPIGLDDFHSAFPNKSMNETECTQDVNAIWPKTIDLIIQNAQHWANVVAGWNVALDPTGGPMAACSDVNPSTCTIHGTNMTAPTVISGPAGQATASFTREYYEMGHASKFVRPGAVRIGSTSVDSVMSVAFRNPDGSKVLIVHNNRTSSVSLGINIESGQHFERINLPPDAIATVEW